MSNRRMGYVMCWPWRHEWKTIETEKIPALVNDSNLRIVEGMLAHDALFGFKRVTQRCELGGVVRIVRD